MNLIISHIADVDGMAPVILGKLVFTNLDYELYDVVDVNNAIIEHLNNNDFAKYDNVFITDLSISYEVASLVQENGLDKKVKIFDHHLASERDLKDFSFSFSKVQDKDKLVCGSSLFYDFLRQNYPCEILKKKSVQDFVELVRLNDTWEWKEVGNYAARDLASIHALYGNDWFINNYVDYLKEHDEFAFLEKEKFLLDIEHKKISDYIAEKEKTIIEANLLNYSVGIVFAELYRSELGNFLAEKYVDKYDFIVIVNLGRSSVSYRGIKEANLSEVASCFGGGGHHDAAGSPINNELLRQILEAIFKDKIEFKA